MQGNLFKLLITRARGDKCGGGGKIFQRRDFFPSTRTKCVYTQRGGKNKNSTKAILFTDTRFTAVYKLNRLLSLEEKDLALESLRLRRHPLNREEEGYEERINLEILSVIDFDLRHAGEN